MSRKRAPTGPGVPITSAWKRRVLEILADNKRAGRAPSNPNELAALVQANRSGLHRMLHSAQPTYKYAPAICAALGIDEPMIERAMPADEWDQEVAYIRSLSPARQRLALALVRTLRQPIDD